jgi:hypothetical protein
MKVPLETVITALYQLVRHTAQEPGCPFGVFFRGIDWLAFPDALFIFPGYRVLGISPVQSQYVVIENVFLASSDIRVNG